MNWLASCGAVLLSAVVGAGVAQSSELKPFKATYDVFMDGKLQGESRMSLVEEASGYWLHTIETQGTSGMARMSGFAATQTTRFHETLGRLQMLSAMSRNELLIRTREVNATFDWSAGVARWSGDLKADRRAPTPLNADAVNSSLLNLLLAMDSADAPPSSVLRYTQYERGSADSVNYIVGDIEAVKVPAGTFEAIKLRSDRPEKNKTITAWYAANLPPTPVRLLQVERDKPSYDLRLRSISK